MSPPIFTPDGSKVSEVILPDGSTASKVIAPDGRTVFGAIPDGTVDNYEAAIYEDQSRSLSDLYNGDTGIATRQQTTVIDGDTTLELAGSAGVIVSTSGLPNYPTLGDNVRCRMRANVADTNYNFKIGAADTSNWYAVEIAGKTDEFRVSEFDSGNFTELDATSFSPSADESYDALLETTSGGDLTATLEDSTGTQVAQTATVNVGSFFGDGIGFEWIENIDSGDAAFFDNYRIV